MKKYIKIISLVLIALIFIGTFVFLYQKSQPKDTAYNILHTQTTDLAQITVATGKIEPRDEVQIKPQISGIISEVYKEAGETVKKGEIIAKVKVIPELGSLNSAESRVRLAEINGRQAETALARKDSISSQTSQRRTPGCQRQPGNREGRYHQKQCLLQQHADSFYN